MSAEASRAANSLPREANPLLREPWVEFGRQTYAGRFGMWVFLSSEILFFGALILAYSVYRWRFPAGFAAAGHETNLVFGTLNTVILLSSSFTIAMAAQIASGATGERLPAREHRLVSGMIAATIALGFAFLVVKGFEYREDLVEHLWPRLGFKLAAEPGADIFFALYWLITAVHATHLTIGLVMLTRLLVIGLRGGRPYAHNPQLEIATLYWHLVDIVWIFLYPLIYLPGRALA